MADSLASSIQELDLEPKMADDPQIIIQNLVQRCQALYDEVEKYIAAVDANHKGSKLPFPVEYKGLRYVYSMEILRCVHGSNLSRSVLPSPGVGECRNP